MVILLKIKRRDFFHRDSIPILVSCTVKTQKFKLLYFRNETCYRTGNAFKRVVKLKKSFISSQHFSLVVFCYCTVLNRMQHPLMEFLGFIQPLILPFTCRFSLVCPQVIPPSQGWARAHRILLSTLLYRATCSVTTSCTKLFALSKNYRIRSTCPLKKELVAFKMSMVVKLSIGSISVPVTKDTVIEWQHQDLTSTCYMKVGGVDNVSQLQTLQYKQALVGCEPVNLLQCCIVLSNLSYQIHSMLICNIPKQRFTSYIIFLQSNDLTDPRSYIY